MTHITTERLKEIAGWLTERHENCLRIAALKDHYADKAGWLTDGEYFEGSREVISELLQRREADRWIPTSEALPKECQLVSGRFGNNTLHQLYLGSDRQFHYCITGAVAVNVTHWRPLPEFQEEK